jgi:hypothetical protein
MASNVEARECRNNVGCFRVNYVLSVFYNDMRGWSFVGLSQRTNPDRDGSPSGRMRLRSLASEGLTAPASTSLASLDRKKFLTTSID